MKINVKNKDKVIETVKKVEKNAKARCLNIERLSEYIKNAENQLKRLGIPKKNWKGCYILIEPEAVPNSYNYAAYGTYAIITYFSSGWFLSSVRRYYAKKEAYGGDITVKLLLSENAKNAVTSEFRIN